MFQDPSAPKVARATRHRWVRTDVTSCAVGGAIIPVSSSSSTNASASSTGAARFSAKTASNNQYVMEKVFRKTNNNSVKHVKRTKDIT
ncbi:hypothetical protein Btru_053283 [Bulinus truncatus]|nr:hypothetical protein Btru_053283 [Bulinus truncatus]